MYEPQPHSRGAVYRCPDIAYNCYTARPTTRYPSELCKKNCKVDLVSPTYGKFDQLSGNFTAKPPHEFIELRSTLQFFLQSLYKFRVIKLQSWPSFIKWVHLCKKNCRTRDSTIPWPAVEARRQTQPAEGGMLECFICWKICIFAVFFQLHAAITTF